MTKDLATLAQEINKDLETAETADGLAQDARLQAAIALAEAEKQCLAQEIPFYAWAKDNIRCSASKIAKLIRIGRSADPAAELRKVRAEGRSYGKKYEGHRADFARHAKTLEGIKEAFLLLPQDEKAAFLIWVDKLQGIPQPPTRVVAVSPAATQTVMPSLMRPPDRARLMAGR